MISILHAVPTELEGDWSPVEVICLKYAVSIERARMYVPRMTRVPSFP